MNDAMVAIEMANEQLEQGWVELDENKYDSVSARLEMVAKLIRDAEREYAKMTQ